MHMEVTVNTHAVTVSTMPPVTDIMKRVRMGVKKGIQEVIVNNVSVSKFFYKCMKKPYHRIFLHTIYSRNVFIDGW